MSKTKTEFKYYTIFHWREEQEYLRKQHRHGLKFIKVNGLGVYHFEKCEPEDVVYQLDYNPEGLAQKDEYVQMFKDCGWEYLNDYVGYSYFRKPAVFMKGDEEIFCDETSRHDMMKRVVRGRILPLLIIFFALILPQLIQSSREGMTNIFTLIFAGLGSIYLSFFIWFTYQYWKYMKS